jgi:hypothetical protein
MVVLAPGEVDWSLDGAGVDDVSLEGELAEPPGEVDCCFEQADMSASEPTHNNRTLRFIDHLTTVTGLCRPTLEAKLAPFRWSWTRQGTQSQEAFRARRGPRIGAIFGQIRYRSRRKVELGRQGART